MELHLPERVAFAGTLAVVALVVGLHVVLVEIAGILLDLRQDLLLHDVLRDVPVRAEHHRRHAIRQSTGVGLVLLAGDDLHVEHALAVLDRVEAERRDVDEQVARAEIVRQPAPALHVHHDLFDRGGVLLLPREHELVLQPEILRRMRRQAGQRLADVVLVEPGVQRVAQVDGARGGRAIPG